jgi:Uma2 family endonuclease
METLTALVENIYSVEEYFELERHSTVRHEFVNGKLYEMPGESKIANKIAGNIYIELRRVFDETESDVFQHDVKMMVRDGRIYRYPDVVVANDGSSISDLYNLREPILAVEVFSADSEHRDNVVKLREYTAIPSMNYYLTVSQDEVFVQFFYRNGGGKWQSTFYEDMEETIDFPMYNFRLSLKQIYHKIIFPLTKV